MTHVKIHKHHFGALLLSCFILIVSTMHHSMAENDIEVKNHKTIYTYSEEVELHSAPEYSPAITEKKKVYKEAFTKILENKLEKISAEKLGLISERIQTKLEKIDDNENISQDKKDKIVSQLLALLEIIKEQIEYNKEYSIEIDLEELLSI